MSERETISQKLQRYVDAIGSAASEAERQSAISDMLKAVQRFVASWCTKSITDRPDANNSTLDDLVSECLTEIYRTLNQIGRTETTAKVQNWYAYLRTISTRAIGKYFNSSAHSGLAGTSHIGRRSTTVATVRESLFTDLGREPTQEEIINEANEATVLRRLDAAGLPTLDLTDSNAANARKKAEAEGSLLSDRDFTLVMVDSTPDFADIDPMMVAFDAGIDDVVEILEIVQAIINHVAANIPDKNAVLVCKAWLGDIAAEPPLVRTSTEIGQVLGISRQSARKLLAKCVDAAKLVCETQFGIDASFAAPATTANVRQEEVA